VPGIFMVCVYFTSLCATPALRMLAAATAMNLQIDCVFDIVFFLLRVIGARKHYGIFSSSFTRGRLYSTFFLRFFDNLYKA
jgi:hypothetical protein